MAQIIHVGRGSGDKRANVIFLHGFGGDLKGTWRHGLGDEFFWPRWLAEDVPGLAVYSLGHDPEQSRHCVQGAWRARKRHEAPRTGGHSPFARPCRNAPESACRACMRKLRRISQSFLKSWSDERMRRTLSDRLAVAPLLGFS